MKKNRQVISQIAIILIFMVGILTMLYPFYVDALNNVIDQVRVDRYLKESQKEFEAERKKYTDIGFRVVTFLDGNSNTNIHDGIKALIKNHWDSV